MNTPDITSLLSDPALGAQRFTILRHPGSWVDGRFVSSTEQIEARGNIQPASPFTLSQLPEGERANGLLVLRTATPIQMARDSEPYALSDEILWRGDTYKLVRLNPWADYGFYEGYLERL